MTASHSSFASALRFSAALALSLGMVSMAQAPAAVAPAQAPTLPSAVATPAIDTPVPSVPADATTSASEHRSGTARETPVAPAAPPEASTEFQLMVQSTTGRALPIFGASLFSGVPSTFAPVEDVPVGPGYVLGPGDEISVQMSGQVNQKLTLRVDRSGAIQVPGLGAVQVAGLTYSQLTPFLNQQLGRIYRGFTLNAQLAQLRTIQVFVVGQARRPGSYSISSLSTLLNAIFVSGGPAANGSVRDIQVKRAGKVIDDFDLYDLLLHGDKTHDITLEPGDVIFFPYVGPQVAVLGSVDAPAIYELKGATTLSGALELAGGATSLAATAAVRLERVHAHADRSFADVALDQQAATRLEDGDIVSVGSILDRFENSVTLRGNVANPGRYVWHPGMRLADLFPSKDALITRNYWRKRDQLGQFTQDYLAGANGETGQSTQEGSLQIHSNSADRQSASAASATQAGSNSVGAALAAGNNVFQARTDVVLSAPDIDWSYAVIDRLNEADLSTTLIPFNLGKLVLDHDGSQNLELLPGDVITIFSKADVVVPSKQQTRFVRLEGEFGAAGVYSVLPGETLRQLVARAGGLTPDAYLYASEFTRESTRRVEAQRRDEIANTLEAQISSTTARNQARAITPADQQAVAASQADAQSALARLRAAPVLGRITLNFRPDTEGVNEIPEVALEDGDRFVVPRIPADVHVQGEVYSATAFLYEKGARVESYLKHAGGPNRDADKHRIYVVRASGELVSQQYGNVLHAPIYPGDTIVVPPTLDRRAVFQRVLDIAQIISSLGIGVAAAVLVTR